MMVTTLGATRRTRAALPLGSAQLPVPVDMPVSATAASSTRRTRCAAGRTGLMGKKRIVFLNIIARA
jgi:hypothetical protein